MKQKRHGELLEGHNRPDVIQTLKYRILGWDTRVGQRRDNLIYEYNSITERNRGSWWEQYRWRS